MSNQELENFQYAFRHYWKRYRLLFTIWALAMVCLSMGYSMFYKVDPDSRGVVLRLGKFLEKTEPGLHFKRPWPIDKAYVVPVTKVQSIEFGYSTVAAGRKTQYAPANEQRKRMSRMLTGDLNLALVEWVVQYQIKDPYHYLFKIGGDRGSSHSDNARLLISDVSEAVMRRIVGDVSVDWVITEGRDDIAAKAKMEMQEMLDRFESGIRIVAVKLQSAAPPDEVKDAFDNVNRAKQNNKRIVNDAKGERNKLLPAKRGEKERAILEAEGYRARVIQEARGRAKAFENVLAEYKKAPDITRKRLYLEAMEGILAQVDEKIVIDESVKGMLPLLHLDAGSEAVAGGKGGAR
ncbi:MAG: FtsH protease activity modulator HflK [Phycisphaerales bacterium]|nr:FtsH protease activity modulator HflK [Phycisphaerales bacterium]